MTRIRRRLRQLSTMLVGMSFASVAFAVATVDVTYTGPQARINETTIQLFDGDGKSVPVKPIGDSRNRFSVASGTYGAEVYVGGKQVGSRTSVTLVEGGNSLRVNSETGLVEIVPTLAMNLGPLGVVRPGAITISGGAGSVKDKPPTTGVDVTTDTALLAGPSRVTTYNLDANLELLREDPEKTGQPETEWDKFRRTMGFYGCRWNIGGSWSDPSRSTQAPPGTHTGWAYWTLAPNGSTGISSAGGADAHIQTRFSEVHVNWSVGHPLKEQAPWSVLGMPMLGYQHAEFKYNASVTNLTVPGVSSTTDQKTKEDDFNVGYGVLGAYKFPNGASAGAGVGLDAILYHFRYNGTQDNLCSVCAAPVDRFTVATSDSKSGVTWGASVHAFAGVPIAQNAEIFVLGSYDYHNRSAVVTSKITPTDDAPHLRAASRESANGQVGVRVRF